jgi:hypothetical protein
MLMDAEAVEGGSTTGEYARKDDGGDRELI